MRSLAACLFLLLLAITCVSVETDTNTGVPTPSPTFTLGLLSSPPESTPNPLEQLIEQVRQETIADESMTPTPYELPATPTVGPTPTLSPTNTPIPLFMDSDMLVDIVQQVRPAIVKVRIPGSTGSGVIFQADGRDAYILTNEHVVRGSTQITVYVNDSQGYNATVLGEDAQRDLAMLKICCGNFTALSFGNASELKPGLQVITIGYALGLEGEASVTTGIISAIRYDRGSQRWVVQTDSAINPGNSGGPMLSTDGTILGINTYKIDQSDSGRDAEGVGFAVSIDTVLQHLEQLRNNTVTPQATPTATPRPTARPTPTTVYRPTPTPRPTAMSRPTPTNPQVATATPRPTPRPEPAQSEASSFGPVNDKLRILLERGVAANYHDFVTDGSMTIEATFHHPEVYSDLAYGLIFRWVAEQSMFLFQVSNYDRPFKRWHLHKAVFGDSGWQWEEMDQGTDYSEEVPFINLTPGKPDALKVVVVNDQVVRLSINGVAVHDAASLPYPEDQYYDISDAPSDGYVGVYASIEEPNGVTVTSTSTTRTSGQRMTNKASVSNFWYNHALFPLYSLGYYRCQLSMGEAQ